MKAHNQDSLDSVGDQRDLSGQTALHVASVAGHAEFVSALLQVGVTCHPSRVVFTVTCHVSRVTLQHPDTDPNIRDLVHGATPLVAALVQGHGHVVRWVSRVTCHVSRVTCHNSSVLVADDDVDINTADTRGHTPLIIGELQLVVLYN